MNQLCLLLLSLIFCVTCSPNDTQSKATRCDPLIPESDATVTDTRLTDDESRCPEINTETSQECPECSECMECETCPEPSVEPSVEPPVRELNLDLNQDNLYAWRKARADLDPDKSVVFYWVGYVYNQQAKDPADFGPTDYNLTFESPIFRFEGFNIARFADDGVGGFVMLSREVSVYQDPNTKEIIDCWRNQLHEDSPRVRVMHVANDPVNFGVGYINHVELGDRISFFSDVIVSYRSPLAGDPQLSPFSASDVYQSNELFNFIASRKDLENEALDTVPVEISWTRVGQYLPWMQMGDRPGQLIYHARGYKVLGGVEALPPSLLAWTSEVAGEEYLTAPDSIPDAYTSNATSWRVFKAAIDAGTYTPNCP